jgi:hypothetical protein
LKLVKLRKPSNRNFDYFWRKFGLMRNLSRIIYRETVVSGKCKKNMYDFGIEQSKKNKK